MQSWIQELRQLGPPNLVLAIAGNKVDIEQLRQVWMMGREREEGINRCIDEQVKEFM